MSLSKSKCWYTNNCLHFESTLFHWRMHIVLLVAYLANIVYLETKNLKHSRPILRNSLQLIAMTTTMYYYLVATVKKYLSVTAKKVIISPLIFTTFLRPHKNEDRERASNWRLCICLACKSQPKELYYKTFYGRNLILRHCLTFAGKARSPPK